jgi:hypothetical protein
MRFWKSYIKPSGEMFRKYFSDLVVVITSLYILLFAGFVLSLSAFKSVGFSEMALYNLLTSKVSLFSLLSSYFFPSFISLFIFLSFLIFIKGAALGVLFDCEKDIRPNLQRAIMHGKESFFRLYLLLILYLFLMFTTMPTAILPPVISFLFIFSPFAVVSKKKEIFEALKSSYRTILKKPFDTFLVLLTISFITYLSSIIFVFSPILLPVTPVLIYLSQIYSMLLLMHTYLENS